MKSGVIPPIDVLDDMNQPIFGDDLYVVSMPPQSEGLWSDSAKWLAGVDLVGRESGQSWTTDLTKAMSVFGSDLHKIPVTGCRVFRLEAVLKRATLSATLDSLMFAPAVQPEPAPKAKPSNGGEVTPRVFFLKQEPSRRETLSDAARDILFHACGLQTDSDRVANRDWFAAGSEDAAVVKSCRELIDKMLAVQVGRNGIYTGFNIRITPRGKALAEALWAEEAERRLAARLKPAKAKKLKTKKYRQSRAKYEAWLDYNDLVSFKEFLTSPQFKDARENAIRRFR